MYTLAVVVEKNRLKVTARSLCKRIKWNMSFYAAAGFLFWKNITEITSPPCHLFPSVEVEARKRASVPIPIYNCLDLISVKTRRIRSVSNGACTLPPEMSMENEKEKEN